MTERMECVLSAEEVLRECIAEDFETVCILGFKNGRIYTRQSRNMGTLELIGALEVTKQELWKES